MADFSTADNLKPIMRSKFGDQYDVPNFIPIQLHRKLGANTRAFASQNSARKSRRRKEARETVTPKPNKRPLGENDGLADDSPRGDDNVQENDNMASIDNLGSKNTTSITIPSRGSVLQACTVTSGFIAALGVIIRQVSHVASVEGWAIADFSNEISFSFEMWHLELITGLIVLISSCRYLLLKTWPDFAESSQSANQQVLTSLQPLDYVVVAFLPGISEELLFRGAMLPLFGTNLLSAVVVAVIFGFLHLGSGRKYSFAVWATFVGLAYGYAAILSSSIIVPMASHALNNLVGGIIWRYSSNSS
ncbi:hypothetical protein LguiB_024694 [Lonicera macranthoides]